jgi:hypothetical protein
MHCTTCAFGTLDEQTCICPDNFPFSTLSPFSWWCCCSINEGAATKPRVSCVLQPSGYHQERARYLGLWECDSPHLLLLNSMFILSTWTNLMGEASHAEIASWAPYLMSIRIMSTISHKHVHHHACTSSYTYHVHLSLCTMTYTLKVHMHTSLLIYMYIILYALHHEHPHVHHPIAARVMSHMHKHCHPVTHQVHEF